uniref:Uncharacterized protein n=1 Tax=Panagrolaimus sp. JU765 TaxID=591449 RepID=A0AC34Q7D4_9BILA
MENDENVTNTKVLDGNTEVDQPTWWEPTSERCVTFESLESCLSTELLTALSVSDDDQSDS